MGGDPARDLRTRNLVVFETHQRRNDCRAYRYRDRQSLSANRIMPSENPLNFFKELFTIPKLLVLVENWPAGPRNAVIQIGSCGFCNPGRARAGGYDPHHESWHCPFDTLQAARNFSAGLPKSRRTERSKKVRGQFPELAGSPTHR